MSLGRIAADRKRVVHRLRGVCVAETRNIAVIRVGIPDQSSANEMFRDAHGSFLICDCQELTPQTKQTPHAVQVSMYWHHGAHSTKSTISSPTPTDPNSGGRASMRAPLSIRLPRSILNQSEFACRAWGTKGPTCTQARDASTQDRQQQAHQRWAGNIFRTGRDGHASEINPYPSGRTVFKFVVFPHAMHQGQMFWLHAESHDARDE